jgi:Ca2+-binding RTX toxin-like protein
VSINGIVQGTFTPTGRIIAFGQAGDDDIQVAGGVGQQAMLFGDAGNDRLKAGNGNSVLVGGSGDDVLIGGLGRNILIGGTGSDNLNGGPGDDILIGGSTTYDSNLAALAAILDEWSRTDRSFAIRQADLQNGGGLNGLFVLNDSTVIDDLAADILNGSSGNDWLILGVGDKKNGQ